MIHCRSTTHSSLPGLDLELPSLWIRVVPVGKGKGRTKLLLGRGAQWLFFPVGPGPGSPVSFEVLDQQETVKTPIYVFIAKRQNEETLNPLPTLHFLFRRLIYIFPPFLSSWRVCSLWGFSGLPSTSIPTQQALQIPPPCPHYLSPEIKSSLGLLCCLLPLTLALGMWTWVIFVGLSIAMLT